MVVINHKGGYSKALTITRNHGHESTTMLKDEFLKKTQNYIVQVQHFYTSKSVPINTLTGILFEIVPLELVTMPGTYQPRDYQFSGTFYNISELLRELNYFFHRFSHKFLYVGLPNVLGNIGATQIDADDLGARHTNFFHTFPGGGYSALPDNANLCQVTMTPDSKLKILMKPLFSSNFFIRMNPTVQSLLGFAANEIYIYEYFLETTTHEDDDLDQFDQDGEVNVRITGRVLLDDDNAFLSTNSLDYLDTRLTLDILSTFPNSNKIQSINGKESHERVLARFPISDYKQYDIELTFRDTVTEDLTFKENSVIGLEDMTRGNPDCESNFLIPGSIQLIKLRLEARYYEDSKIVIKHTDIDAGFWTLRLLFTKKV